MTDFPDLAPEDQQAIGKTLLTLLTGFRERDAQALHAVYSDDADWVNAFGTVKRGSKEIVDYLRGLFADDNFNRGEPEGPPETSFRVLTPEVVLVSAHLRIKGQGLVDGGYLENLNWGTVVDMQPAGLGSRIQRREARKPARSETPADDFPRTDNVLPWQFAPSSSAQPWLQVQL